MWIGFCNEEDKVAIRALYESCFEDSMQFVDYYFAEKVIPQRVLGIKENDTLISMLHLNPFQVYYNGEIYPVSYIVAVATDAKYRNKGYMGKIMKEALNRLYEMGESFTLLMPIDSRIYERYGFGFIEDHLILDCTTNDFMIKKRDYKSKKVLPEDIPALVERYERYCTLFNLSTYRDHKEFIRLYQELHADEGEIILFDEGYLMTYYEGDDLHVREIVSNSNTAFQEMLSYLMDKSDTRVIIHDHLKSKVKYIIPNTSENKIQLQPFMMSRIINVEKFLKLNEGLFVEDIRIQIHDPYIEKNNGTYFFKNGRPVRDNENTEDYDYKFTMKEFTQLLFGYIDPKEICNQKMNNTKKDLFKKRPDFLHFFNEYV